MHSRILIVEDEYNLGATLSERLRAEGYDAHWVRSVQECLALPLTQFDCVVLDISLPDGSGLDIAVQLKAKNIRFLFVSAHASPDDRVKGLALGAEDYVIKPFRFEELLLRLHRKPRFQLAPNIEIDLGRMLIRRDGQEYRLGQKEAAIMRMLIEANGQVVSRDTILDRVWLPEEYPTPRTVDNFIVRLRRILETDPTFPRYLCTVRGLGYQLLRKDFS